MDNQSTDNTELNQSPPKQGKVKFLPLLLASGIMLLVGIGIGYSVHRELPKKENVAIKVSPTPSEAPTPFNYDLTPSPTPKDQQIITGSNRKGWITYSSDFTNLSLSYPENWKLLPSRQGDQVNIVGPSGLKLVVQMGIIGVGGGCEPDPLNAITYESVSFMKKPFFLRLVKPDNKPDSDAYELAIMLESPQQCPNVGFIDIKNLGTEQGTDEKSEHEGLTYVTISYPDNKDKLMSKTKNEFMSADYVTAKEILSTATYNN